MHMHAYPSQNLDAHMIHIHTIPIYEGMKITTKPFSCYTTYGWW